MTARRRQVPVAQRRAELAEAALRVMRRDGAWTVTTRAVAIEAGVPHGSVHYAFSSKEAMLQAVIAADTEHAVNYFARAGETGGTAVQVLAAAFRAYTDGIKADPQTELVLQELTLMAAREPALRDLIAQSGAGYRASVERMLTDLARRCGGEWDASVGLLAEQLLGTMFGVGIAWLVDRDDALLDAVLEDVARSTAARLRVRTESDPRSPD